VAGELHSELQELRRDLKEEVQAIASAQKELQDEVRLLAKVQTQELQNLVSELKSMHGVQQQNLSTVGTQGRQRADDEMEA